jgi:general secretion pathway protein J
MKGNRTANTLRARGFTLLELLIAMSLMGLIFAAMTGGLRFGTQAWRTTAERLSQSDDLQLVYRTLRRQISASLNLPGDLIESRKKGSFEGLRDELSFIGAAPALAMNPGLFHLKFVLVPDKVGQALALRWERLENKPITTDSDNIETVLRGLQSVQFSYYGVGDDDDRARWVDEWRDRENPPRLVRITFIFADSDRMPWPSFIIPLPTSG